MKRDVEVARRAVGPAQLLVGTSGEQHVAVKGTALLADPPRVHGRPRPPRFLVEPPTDMRDGIAVGVSELVHVILHQGGIELAREVGDPALFDPQGDRGASVGFERVDDGARSQDHRALHAVVVGAGEQES